MRVPGTYPTLMESEDLREQNVTCAQCICGEMLSGYPYRKQVTSVMALARGRLRGRETGNKSLLIVQVDEGRLFLIIPSNKRERKDRNKKSPYCDSSWNNQVRQKLSKDERLMGKSRRAAETSLATTN